MSSFSLRQMRELFLTKKLSPSEVVEDYLARIEKHQDANIYITVNAQQARHQAALATQRYQLGEASGLLEGIPVAYKDNIFVRGLPNTAGSAIEKSFIPTQDAPAVRRMQQAGAINLGKLNLHEYAFGITSQNPFYGAVENPWNRRFSPGGSSGGSGAALAANLAMVTLGTDTGGSIRIPAAACGVIGLKATRDTISGQGTRPISASLDHVGPLTKTVEDMALSLEVLTGHDYLTHLPRSLKGLRIGVPTNYFWHQVDAAVGAAYERALQQLQALGAVLIEVDVPYTEADAGVVFALAICEGAAEHAERMAQYKDQYGTDVWAALSAAQNFSAVDYIKAKERQVQLTHQFEALLQDIDVLITPTTPVTAQEIGVNELEVDGQMQDLFGLIVHNCAPFNVTGHPALSLPCGLGQHAIPIGLQLVSAHHRERVLLQVAYAYERHYLADFYAQREQVALN